MPPVRGDTTRVCHCNSTTSTAQTGGLTDWLWSSLLNLQAMATASTRVVPQTGPLRLPLPRALQQHPFAQAAQQQQQQLAGPVTTRSTLLLACQKSTISIERPTQTTAPLYHLQSPWYPLLHPALRMHTGRMAALVAAIGPGMQVLPVWQVLLASVLSRP